MSILDLRIVLGKLEHFIDSDSADRVVRFSSPLSKYVHSSSWGNQSKTFDKRKRTRSSDSYQNVKSWFPSTEGSKTSKVLTRHFKQKVVKL